MIPKEQCLRCGGEMQHTLREEIQLGRTGFFIKHLDNIAAGSYYVDIYVCADCNKMEFYSLED